MLTLEGAQAGLSWSTILKRRDGYRDAFDDFDPRKVAAYDEEKIASLLSDERIIRNRMKVPPPWPASPPRAPSRGR